MRNNKELLEKIKKMDNAVNPELETTEAFVDGVEKNENWKA